MRHPELFAVTALTLADYYLTLLGAKMAEQDYRRHFKSESYELNPVWRGDVARVRWLNPRHLALAVVITAILWWAGETDFAPWFYPLLFGMSLGAFVPIIAQHLGNICMFDFLRRHPGEISGAVTVSMRYAIVASLGQGLVVFALLAVVAALAPSPVVFGMLLGSSVLMAARLSWLARAKPPAAEPPRE
jgi:hypothetical protein